MAAQGQGGGRLQQIVGVLEATGRPFRRGDDFRRADPPVLVRVDEIERLRVEFDPARRAGQRDPQLLVEFVEVGEVGPPVQFHLVEAARAKETPSV